MSGSVDCPALLSETWLVWLAFLLAVHPRRASGQGQSKRCNGGLDLRWLAGADHWQRRSLPACSAWGLALGRGPFPSSASTSNVTSSLPPSNSSCLKATSWAQSQVRWNATPSHHSITAHHCTYHSASYGKRPPASGPFHSPIGSLVLPKASLAPPSIPARLLNALAQAPSHGT